MYQMLMVMRFIVFHMINYEEYLNHHRYEHCKINYEVFIFVIFFLKTLSEFDYYYMEIISVIKVNFD